MTGNPLIDLLGGVRAAAFAALALALLAFGGCQTWRLTATQRDLARQESRGLKADVRSARATREKERAERELEHTMGDALAHIANAYEKGREDGKAAADRTLADVRDGRLVLRDRFKCPARRGAGPTSAGPSSRDGEEGALLSGADSEFLLRLGAEADDVVRQLAACQAVIEADRNMRKPGPQ